MITVPVYPETESGLQVCSNLTRCRRKAASPFGDLVVTVAYGGMFDEQFSIPNDQLDGPIFISTKVAHFIVH